MLTIFRTPRLCAIALGTGAGQRKFWKLILTIVLAVPSPVLAMDWSFEPSATEDVWETGVGDAFASQPTFGDNISTARVKPDMGWRIGGDYWRDVSYPIGSVGPHWIGTYEARPTDAVALGSVAGGGATGRLQSREFEVKHRYIHFLVGGPVDPKVRVELQIATADYDRQLRSDTRSYGRDGAYTILAKQGGTGHEELTRRWWTLKPTWMGRRFRIVIIDDSPTGHINVDDFKFVDALPPFLKVGRDRARFYDAKRPVWGIADTHAHPQNILGFGGKAIAGRPTGRMSDALAYCTLVHGVGGFSTISIVEGGPVHLVGGYPEFNGWPKFTSKIHQQMHEEWIYRAYVGGLRLMSGLAVTNMFVATRLLGPGTDGKPIDDFSTAKRQIAAIQQMARRNSTWMEVARTPSDARRIIASNKLALVLGVELDNLANMIGPNYTWKFDGNVVVPDDPADARRVIRKQLDELVGLGVRQVTPLHYVSGVFGGTALFSKGFELVNFAFTGQYYDKVDATALGTRFVLSNDPSINWANQLLLEGVSGVGQIGPDGADTWKGERNALGLTEKGKILIEELMARHLIVDIDHMSYAAANEVLDMGKQAGNYPFVSSHQGPSTELAFSGDGRFDPNDPAKNFQTFATTQPQNLSHEGMRSAAQVTAIKELGGFVSPLMSLYRVHPSAVVAARFSTQVDNDLEGSSKTWAQMYLWTLDKMGGTGVALSTDRGFIDFIGPRFGVQAAYPLKSETVPELRIDLRRRQATAQQNGVRYAEPIKTYQAWRFPEWDEGLYSAAENDAFRAIATAHAAADNGYDWKKSDFRNYLTALRNGKVSEMTAGIYYALLGRNLQFDDVGGGGWEPTAGRDYRIAGFVVASKAVGRAVAIEDVLAAGVSKDAVVRIVMLIEPIYERWQAMSGNNAPLRRSFAGERDFDVNLDGVAHYGMLPDFLQDLRNVGIGPKEMAPLFSSAETYIRTWEKAIGVNP